MASTTFIDLRINSAEQLKESLAEPSPNTKIYLAFGKVDPWPLESGEPVRSPSSIKSIYDIWNNMIGGKRINGSDIAFVIPRYNWAANTDYAEYDDLDPNLYNDTPLYVVTDTFDVYKCIANNNGSLSTVKPTSYNPSATIKLSDGYVWKYMYTISDADQLRFTTNEYIPVKTLIDNDGSLQWQVQNNAISGAIHHIKVIDGGSGYTNANSVVVTVTGDGSGYVGNALINVTSQKIEAIETITVGQGYNYASVTISGGGGNGANARAIISPVGGHGHDPLYELGGKNVMINAKLRYSENGVLPVTNDYHQITLLKDPIDRLTNNVATIPAYNQGLEIVTAGAGDYEQDEYVYQGSSFESASFSGQVVEYNPTTNKVLLINTKGIPQASRSLIGANSVTARVISSVTPGQMVPYSGKILYCDNLKPIARAADQIEDFKIVIEY